MALAADVGLAVAMQLCVSTSPCHSASATQLAAAVPASACSVPYSHLHRVGAADLACFSGEPLADAAGESDDDESYCAGEEKRNEVDQKKKEKKSNERKWIKRKKLRTCELEDESSCI